MKSEVERPCNAAAWSICCFASAVSLASMRLSLTAMVKTSCRVVQRTPVRGNTWFGSRFALFRAVGWTYGDYLVVRLISCHRAGFQFDRAPFGPLAPMRSVEREGRYEECFAKFKSKNVVAIEFGAGLAVPTVRVECQKRSKTLIRVNPRDYLASVDSISLPLNALAAIQGIDEFLR